MKSLYIVTYLRLLLTNLQGNLSFLFSPRQKADLLLVKVDLIGDYIVWTDALRAFKKKYVGKKVVIVCNKTSAGIVRTDGFFSDVIEFDASKFALSAEYRKTFTARLKSYTFQEVISPVYLRYWDPDVIVCLANSKNKIGYNGPYYNMTRYKRFFNDLFYSKLIDSIPGETFEIEQNAHFVRELCDPAFQSQLPSLATVPAFRLLEYEYCVFGLYSSDGYRAWDIRNFIDLAKLIPASYKIVLIGHGQKEEELGGRFEISVGSEREVVNLIGKTSLVEMVNVVRFASFLVGNDSSSVHTAVAVRTPSVCIAPGARYNWFVPYPPSLPEKEFLPRVVSFDMECFGCNYRCHKPVMGQYECVRKVSVAQVNEVVSQLIQKTEINILT